MASSSSSSSRSRRYDVFPSFSGEDVRQSFLSHLLKELDRKSITTFIDHGIERSRPIGPELLSAIRESRISIVVFSKSYASSSWCLNELVEIQMLGKEIVRAESIYNPGKRRFLVDTKDICDVFTENLGTENVLGMYFNTSELDEALFINEHSFKGMRNLTFLKVYKEWSWETGEGRLCLPRGYVYLPRKLRLLYWDRYPLTCLRFNFRAEILVKLTMENSNLEKLWEGVQPLRSLKKIRLDGSTKLKELPNLSNATSLEKLNLLGCTSLVTLPSSIRNLNKLRKLSMEGCTKLEVLSTDINLGCLDYLNLSGCSSLRRFPQLIRNSSELHLNGTAIKEHKDCFFIGNSSRVTELVWGDCPMKYLPSNFCAEYLVNFTMSGSKLEKLWEGIQSLGSLRRMDLSGCESLKEIPDLSKATNLEYLDLTNCKSLVMLSSSIRNLKKLVDLKMKGCTGLEVLPNDVNLISLNGYFNLNGCSRLRSFPQISTSIVHLHLDYTAIEKVPSWIQNISGLSTLTMRGCKKLKNVASNSFSLKRLVDIDFSDCEGVTAFSDDASAVTRSTDSQQPVTEVVYSHPGTPTVCAKNCASLQSISHSFVNPVNCLKFHNCFNLDRDAKKLILQSDFLYAVLPGGEVHPYFRHRAHGTSLTISLPESSLSQEVLQSKVCILLEPPIHYPINCSACIRVWWYFRGKRNSRHVFIDVDSCNVTHLVVFYYELYLPEKVSCHSYELGYSDNDLAFDFEAISPHKIKGCGVQLLNVPPSNDGSCTSSETQYNQQCGESDMENERSKKRLRVELCHKSNNYLFLGFSRE